MQLAKVVLSAVVLLSAACATSGGKAESVAKGGQPGAKAILAPTAGHTVNGIVTFTKVADGVLVQADVTGLTPGAHGFHIHEHGDCSAPDATSAGGHFNPTGHQHAAPADEERHAGDLGNLIADETGRAVYEWVDPKMELSGDHTIIGRGVIVHDSEDDFATQPTGNAGGRVACGVVIAD